MSPTSSSASPYGPAPGRGRSDVLDYHNDVLDDRCDVLDDHSDVLDDRGNIYLAYAPWLLFVAGLTSFGTQAVLLAMF